MSATRRRAASFLAVIGATVLAAVAAGLASSTRLDDLAFDPLAAPSFGPPELPEKVQGLTVLSVSDVIEGRADGTFEGGPHAVGGYWSDGQVRHSCAPTTEQVGELELRCIDGEFGITELYEPIFVVDRRGQATVAVGPHLTPWFRNELPGVQRLFELPVINDQRYPPVPIVVVGHFDDARSSDCHPEARQKCLDRLVVDAIVLFNPAAVPTPGVTAPPTPFPAGLAPLFGPERCAGSVVYSFAGWTTTDELQLPFDREGHVYAMVTAGVVDLGGPGSAWNDDPNGSGHRFKPMGRLICIAQEGQEGTMEFGHVPGSEFVLWDDGVTTPGLEIKR